MQFKVFTIPVGDSGSAIQEMNAFLRGHSVIEVDNELVSNERGAYWCFCIRYLERQDASDATSGKPGRTDYKKILDEATFQRFSKLREIRKGLATEASLAAFLIFTDAELAELAALDEITEKAMLGIKGIGETKVARYGKHFITQIEGDETAG